MPQIDFFFGSKDERWLVEACVNAGLLFVADKDRSTPEYETLATADSVIHERDAARLFFLLLPAMLGPLEVREHKSSAKSGQFFIMQRNGCPTIDLLFPTRSRGDGGERIASGFLAYHKTYWDLEAEENLPVPEPLLAVYKSLSRAIRARTRKISGKARTYYLSQELESEVEAGLTLMGVDRDWM